MAQPQDTRFRIHINTRPQAGLIERIVFFVLGLFVLVAAFFFVGIALIAGTLLALVILLRWWWIKRKLRRAHEESFVEGEYRVVEQAITDQGKPRE
jgi:O-antigen/teichoic acid export membrane protein